MGAIGSGDTSGARNAPNATQDYTARSFAIAVLERLHAPVTAQNVEAMVSWEAAEGGHWNNTARYNPLGTTLHLPGSYVMPGGGAGAAAGVQAYQSWNDGITATVDVLNQDNMGAIKRALMVGNNAHAVADAVVNHSPWGTSSITIGPHTDYGTTNVTVPAGEATAGANTVTSSSLSTPPDQKVSAYLDNPDIAASYGYLAAYMKDPQIGPILAKAAKGDWNSGQLLSALQKTTWWKTMSDTKRQMQALQREDPASYQQEVKNKAAQVGALAASMGIRLNGKSVSQIATTALWSNWSDLQLQEAVGSEFKYRPGEARTGQAGADIQQFKAMADAYLVPLSNQTLAQWTRSALEGKIDPKDYTGYLSQQAKTLYPWMAHAIDSGIDPNTYLDPYRQAAAKTLEIDPNSIDFSNPKWLSLVQTVDPKTGQRSELGLANAMTKMRTDPIYGYDKTQGARDQAAAFAASLAHMFGFSGTDSSLSGITPQGV